MNRQMLERLAANPHYKMAPAQLAELQRLRELDAVQHDPSVPTHPTGFQTHPTEPKRQGDARSN